MIESITIAEVATYSGKPEELNGLSNFNYLFGANGTGKTTISRGIADESKFPTCKVSWKAGTKLEPMVYNQDFIERNFAQSAELKGVFTLGEMLVDSLAKIATAKAEHDGLSSKIEALKRRVSEKQSELEPLEEDFKKICWSQKSKLDAKLQGAFEGLRSNGDKFKARVLKESTSNTAILRDLQYLEKRAESVFANSPQKESLFSNIDKSRLLTHETSPILKKRVIGRDEVDIAAIIRKLGNSDWVRQGKAFYQANDGVCPFCQQSIAVAFSDSLNEYFDEAFLADCTAIDALTNSYAMDASRLLQQLDEILAT